MLRIISALLALLWLSACATEDLYGIPPKEWHSYSLAQQAQVIGGYNSIKKVQAREYHPANIEKGAVDVRVYGGRAMMLPAMTMARFKTSDFRVPAGECLTINLLGYKEGESVPLTACFKKRVLSLDASTYIYELRDGGVKLRYSPIWQRGFVYHDINSRGYARLKNTHIKVSFVR